MKLIDGKLYMEFSEMVECGASANYMRKAKSKGTKSWDFMNDPDDNRKVLIGYEALTDKYKETIHLRYGNPYDYVVRQPILNLVEQDGQAHAVYMKYKTGEKFLDKRTVNQYTRAASWLNMLLKVKEDRSIIKEELGIKKIPDFYLQVSHLLSIEINNGKSDTYTGLHELPGTFPTSYKRINKKVELYKEEGYEHLIDKRFGNKRAAKIGKTEDGFDEATEERQIAIIRRVASMHNNFDADQVCRYANLVFEKKGWEQVSRRTIYGVMQKYKASLMPGRRGKREYMNTIGMQNKRKAPPHPMLYWSLDGWTVELLYQENGKYDKRMVMVVVLDTMNKYPVGYAIGDRETAALIKKANRNALLHIQHLFGEPYYPHQVQSDRYQLKHLTPFYQALGHLHTPASVGNAKSKVIEPYFKYLNKEYCQSMANWSGFNIDANRKNQVNREMLNLIKKTFPNKEACIEQIERIIRLERERKIIEYRDRWEAAPDETKQVMSKADWMMVFGEAVGSTNRITGQGIVKMIDGIEYTFDSFDPSFRKHINEDWQIIADKDNLSEVLVVSADGKLRFVLHEKRQLAMDAYSTTEEDNEYRQRVKQFNKDRETEIINMYEQDASIVDEVMKDIPLSLDNYNEAALKLMFTNGTGQQKEQLQDAKGLDEPQGKKSEEFNMWDDV